MIPRLFAMSINEGRPGITPRSAYGLKISVGTKNNTSVPLKSKISDQLTVPRPLGLENNFGFFFSIFILIIQLKSVYIML
jgi:hypothetical protein